MRLLTASLFLCSLLSAETTKISSDAKPKGWVPPSQRAQWTITSSLAAGYGSDRQRQDFRSGMKFHFYNLNSATMTGRVVFDFDHIILRFKGDYGWLINGDCRATMINFHPQKFPTFPIRSGYSADAEAMLASRVKFWDYGRGTLSFIPALGYLYSHFDLFPRSQKRAPLPIPIPGFTLMSFTKPFQQDWFGPVFEGRLALECKYGWRFDLFYRYIHLAFRQIFSYAQSDYFFNSNGTLMATDHMKGHVAASRDSLRTQLGGAELSYRSSDKWQLGLHFEGSSTWTGVAKVSTRTTGDYLLSQAFPSVTETTEDQLDISWISYRINFFGSYWF